MGSRGDLNQDTERGLSPLERRLLDEFQHDFPFVPRPFARLGEQLGVDEAEVIGALQRLEEEGTVSRVGPVFRPNRMGSSTLAALAVPPAEIERVAELVNDYPEVNHNYQREHRYNLWFVATAPDSEHLAGILAQIRRRTGLPMLDLPMLEAFHLDLGFRLDPRGGNNGCAPRHARGGERMGHAPRRRQDDSRLVAAIQDGLPLTATPYAAVAERAGMSETQLLERLCQWHEEGTLSRFGVVVRHQELGYRANAMVVWDIPDERVAEVGHHFSGFDFVTLCYRRPRRLPEWRYNLFSMIHGKEREAVRAKVEELAASAGLGPESFEVLFSTRRFKQRGARYQGAPAASPATSSAVGGAPAPAPVAHPWLARA